jgi:hypothetical protein
MRVTVTPTCTQTLREVQTEPGLSGYEWMVTFQIDSDEGLSFALSIPTTAATPLEAQARVLRRVQEFLKAAAMAARDYQI